MARDVTRVPGVFITTTGWTGVANPWTKDTKALHREIAKDQVTHWSWAKIQKMEAAGYFDDLAKQVQVRRIDSLVLHDRDEDDVES